MLAPSPQPLKAVGEPSMMLVENWGRQRYPENDFIGTSLVRRLTERRRHWFARRHQYEARRHARRLAQQRGEIYSVHTHKGTRWRVRAPTGARRLVMPSTLCFDENPQGTLALLRQLRERLDHTRVSREPYSKHAGARLRRLVGYTAFETMQRISPAAALVLAAEYERLLLKTRGGRSSVIGVERWEDNVFETLWNIGFFDLVWAHGVEEPDLGTDVAVLRMQSGNTMDPREVDNLVGNLRALYPGAADTEEGLVHLYGAMIEAIANVPNHAYPASWSRVAKPELRRWWMTGAVDRTSRRTTAVVFDQGVSIPVSLPNWAKAEGWGRRVQRRIGMMPAINDPRSDGEAIAAAVEESMSSTGEHHRGTGLAQMRNFVGQCREGRLRIMSRCGEVVFRPDQEPAIRTYEVPLDGTLIEWSVLL